MPSITAAELIVFASASTPDVDTGTNGGAIDLLRRLAFTQIAANSPIEVLSSSAADTTQTVTLTARSTAGAIVTETKTLTGVTAAIFSVVGTIERVLRVEMSATAAGIVTVRRSVAGLTVGTIPIGERGFMAAFINAAADVGGGASRDYYRKAFVKNTNATLSLLGAAIAQSADPDARITHALGTAVNDTISAATRLTAPGSVTAFDDASKAVPGTDLAAGASIAVWLKLTLPAGDPAHRSTYDLAINGSTA